MKNYLAYRAVYPAPFKGVRAVWRFLLQYYRRFREPVTTNLQYKRETQFLF